MTFFAYKSIAYLHLRYFWDKELVLLNLGGSLVVSSFPYGLWSIVWRMTWSGLIIQPLFKCRWCDQPGILARIKAHTEGKSSNDSFLFNLTNIYKVISFYISRPINTNMVTTISKYAC